jgi:hypothetical protein
MEAIGGFPVSPTDCGLLLALSTMLILAVRTPLAAGLNVIVKVQVAPTPRIPPQFVDGFVMTLKSAAFRTNHADHNIRQTGRSRVRDGDGFRYTGRGGLLVQELQ